MKSRVWDVPALYVTSGRLPAEQFNRVKLGLLRLANPLRLELRHLRTLDLCLSDDHWVCVDRAMNDLPVIAWTDFRTASRRGLHEPVECRVRYYHAHAGVILKTLFADMGALLDERLAQDRGGAIARPVTTLPGAGRGWPAKPT
jgi:hypothetical protein